MSRGETKVYPKKCPGCFTELNNPRSWRNHTVGYSRRAPCVRYLEWKSGTNLRDIKHANSTNTLVSNPNLLNPETNVNTNRNGPAFSSTCFKCRFTLQSNFKFCPGCGSNSSSSNPPSPSSKEDSSGTTDSISIQHWSPSPQSEDTFSTPPSASAPSVTLDSPISTHETLEQQPCKESTFLKMVYENLSDKSCLINIDLGDLDTEEKDEDEGSETDINNQQQDPTHDTLAKSGNIASIEGSSLSISASKSPPEPSSKEPSSTSFAPNSSQETSSSSSSHSITVFTWVEDDEANFTCNPNMNNTATQSDKFKSNFHETDNISINKDKWIELIKMARCLNPLAECPGKLEQTNSSTVGELVKLSFKCNKCCKKFTFSNLESKKIKTSKTGYGIESANLEIVIAWILKGRSWEDYHTQRHSSKLRPMSREVWQNIEKFVYKKTYEIYEEHIKSIMDEYKNQSNLELVLAGDGAWSNRRNAYNGVYVIMDANTGGVVYQFCMSKKITREVANKKDTNKEAEQTSQKNEETNKETNSTTDTNKEKRTIVISEGNYEATSKGMEGTGFRMCMKYLEAQEVLSKVKRYICDQDSSVLSQLKMNWLSHITVYHDIGHSKKNFKTDLEKHLGTKELKPFCGKISGWFMSSIMASRSLCNSLELPTDDKLKLMGEQFVKRMTFWKQHYTQQICDPRCPCKTAKILPIDTPQTIPLFKHEDLSLMTDFLDWLGQNDKTTFFSLTSCCRYLYSLREQERLINYQKPTKKKNMWIDLSKKKPQQKQNNKKNNKPTKQRKTTEERMAEVEKAINLLIKNHKKFAHFWSTCLVESFNAVRSKFIDKDKIVFKYYKEKACLVVLFWNLGKEEVLKALYQKLGLVLTPGLLKYLEAKKHKREMDKTRMNSLEFKKREKFLAGQHTKAAEEEKKKSKETNDFYRTGKQKSTTEPLLAPTPPPDTTTPPSNPNSASLAVQTNTNSRKRKASEILNSDQLKPADVANLKGEGLKKALQEKEMKTTVDGKASAKDQRDRLVQVLSSTDPRSEYPHYFVTQKRLKIK